MSFLSFRGTKVDMKADSSQNWTKSSYSWGNSNCVEVSGVSRSLIKVRDSKNPEGSVLGFALTEWDAFVESVRNGKFDSHL
jgi:hypothetical protein